MVDIATASDNVTEGDVIPMMWGTISKRIKNNGYNGYNGYNGRERSVMPQLTAPVTVVSVTGKQINTKRGPSTIFEVVASDGNRYSTFDAPVAQKAQQLAGQQATISYEVRQNGQYTNYDLIDLHGSFSAPIAQNTPPVAVTVQGGPEKDAKITRLAAHKTAASLVGHLYSGKGEMPAVIGVFRSFVEELVLHAETGRWASGITVQPTAPVVEAARPAQTKGIPWDDAA